MTTSAKGSGTFTLGSDTEVTRLGFIDTADSYGPYVSEDLIREALHPYDGITVATKAGLTRTGPDAWHAVGRPEYLRQCCEMSLRRLDVEAIDLFQLHRIDKKTPREEQFGVLKELQDEGKVKHLGLSEVSVDEIKAAQEVFEVATVQNLFNLTTRGANDVVGGPVDEAARAHDATPGQVALAWLLQHSTTMLPIPGTGPVAHLEENVGGADLQLTAEEIAKLDGAAEAA